MIEGLRVFKRESKQKDEPYQDTVSALLNRNFDEEAVGQEDDDDDDDDNGPDISRSEAVATVLTAIAKVC